jgi:hypothetical protein
MNEQQITIQVGNYANYIGAHFWNFQDEIYSTCQDTQEETGEDSETYNVNQLYRFGKTVTGRQTCTPRALIIEHRSMPKLILFS